MSSNPYSLCPCNPSSPGKCLEQARPLCCRLLSSRSDRAISSLLGAVSLLSLTVGSALAEEPVSEGRPAARPTYEQLLEKLERMEARMRSLEDELHGKRRAEASRAKPRVAKTNTKVANGIAEGSNPAPPPASQEPGVAQPPAPGIGAPAPSHLVEAPGFLGARETAYLEAPPPPEKDLFGVAPSPLPGLRIGAYGEFAFGAQQNPAAFGQWQTGFDTTRLVLTPSYQFNDNIIFNSEIEWEHGGIATDADDKLTGEINIEQAWGRF